MVRQRSMTTVQMSRRPDLVSSASVGTVVRAVGDPGDPRLQDFESSNDDDDDDDVTIFLTHASRPQRFAD